jgi:hypothetical protein
MTEMSRDDEPGGTGPTDDPLIERMVETLRRRLFPVAMPGLDDGTVRRIINEAVLLKLGSPRGSLDRIRALIEGALPDVTGRDPGPVEEVMARIREYVAVSPWSDEAG